MKVCREIWRNATYAAQESVMKTTDFLVRCKWAQTNIDQALDRTVDIPDEIHMVVEMIYEQAY